jgi:hypothetical protein
MKTERATRLPDQLDQQERLREEKIDNAQSRGNQLDATAANMNQERRMREEQYQSQKARRQQRLDAPGPTPMPAPPSEGPSREVEENRNNFYRTTVTNSPIGMGMTAAGAALNALGFEDAGRGLAQAAYPEDDTGPASDRGRAYHQSELQSAQSVRERFNKDGAASPQAAQNVLRNLRRGMTALQKGVYNLDPEERRQMQRQYQREMEYFQRIAPRRDPAQGTAQQIVQGAMENESYGAAVNALEMLRERQQPQR